MTNGMSRAREGRALAALKVSGWFQVGGTGSMMMPSTDLGSAQMK